MTDHVARLYAAALGLAVFFLTWAFVAAQPWGTQAEAAKDPRVAQLERREARLRKQSARVQKVVNRRFAAYRVRLKARQGEIAAIQAANAASASAVPVSSGGGGGSVAAAPSVSVVSVPPVTSSGSS